MSRINFTGCRVVAYGLMGNHTHLLVEVPPLPESGFTDVGLLARMGAIYNEAEVAEAAKELAEAIGGGPRGNGKKARAGLVRARRAHQGGAADAGLWANDVAREYRKLLLAGAAEKLEARVGGNGRAETRRTRKGMSDAEVKKEEEQAGVIPLGRMLRCRVRYFTDGAVIGSRSFVNEVFARARERFGQRPTGGTRRLP